MKYIVGCLVLLGGILNAQQNKPTEKSKVTLANTVDPICNMKVTNATKETAKYDGKTYGFCSSHCKTTFKKDPKKYVKK